MSVKIEPHNYRDVYDLFPYFKNQQFIESKEPFFLPRNTTVFWEDKDLNSDYKRICFPTLKEDETLCIIWSAFKPSIMASRISETLPYMRNEAPCELVLKNKEIEVINYAKDPLIRERSFLPKKLLALSEYLFDEIGEVYLIGKQNILKSSWEKAFEESYSIETIDLTCYGGSIDLKGIALKKAKYKDLKIEKLNEENIENLSLLWEKNRYPTGKTERKTFLRKHDLHTINFAC